MTKQDSVSPVDLVSRYRDYIACLNTHAWADLSQHVAPDVSRNGGEQSGIESYEKLIRDDYKAYPGLRFEIRTLGIQDTEQKLFATLHITFEARSGEQSSLTEDVSYTYEHGKIKEVHSVVQPVS